MGSVDDAIAGLLRSLRETGQIDDTYIVLWNDNGYHMGQHRIPEGKRTVYEEDVRYPMVVRGPNVGHGAKDERLVSGTDLMPTFLELARAPIPEYVDGRSLARLASSGGLRRRLREQGLRPARLQGHKDFRRAYLRRVRNRRAGALRPE